MTINYVDTVKAGSSDAFPFSCPVCRNIDTTLDYRRYRFGSGVNAFWDAFCVHLRCEAKAKELGLIRKAMAVAEIKRKISG